MTEQVTTLVDGKHDGQEAIQKSRSRCLSCYSKRCVRNSSRAANHLILVKRSDCLASLSLCSFEKTDCPGKFAGFIPGIGHQSGTSQPGCFGHVSAFRPGCI